MGFLSQRCPNCGKAISKEAEYCNACGCHAAGTWSTCPKCAASVGAESRFCWKCGAEQNQDTQRKFYGDRWHRSATDFAARIELAVPAKTLHHGLQVDEGTLAALFQNGKFVGTLEPGYHTFDTFFQRLVGADKGKAMHAILVDVQAAEVDFQISGIRCDRQVPVDVRVRLLFRVTDVKTFIEAFFKEAATFTHADLVARFEADVREGLQLILAPRSADEIICELRTRELIEGDLVRSLEPVLAASGLTIAGVRLADFGGPALDLVREKLGEIHRLTRESELNRKLQDALREEKIGAFRDEQQLQDFYEQVTLEFGLKAAGRQREKEQFVAAAEHSDSLERMRHEYEARRVEIGHRLDEQTLRHKSELADVHQELAVRAARFERDLHEQNQRFLAGQSQQKTQAETDLDVAVKGVEALKAVHVAKFDHKKKEEVLALEVEERRLQIRGNASLQALLATVPGDQADRLLKLAELEMRKGITPEQALAMVAERSPEIAPAIAQALQARYQAGGAGRKA